MSPGLRDPLGLDGSEAPKDPEALGDALRQQLRRIQPGLALVIDAFDHLRHRKHDDRRESRPEERPSPSPGTSSSRYALTSTASAVRSAPTEVSTTKGR